MQLEVTDVNRKWLLVASKRPPAAQTRDSSMPSLGIRRAHRTENLTQLSRRIAAHNGIKSGRDESRVCFAKAPPTVQNVMLPADFCPPRRSVTAALSSASAASVCGMQAHAHAATIKRKGGLGEAVHPRRCGCGWSVLGINDNPGERGWAISG